MDVSTDVGMHPERMSNEAIQVQDATRLLLTVSLELHEHKKEATGINKDGNSCKLSGSCACAGGQPFLTCATTLSILSTP